MALFRKSAQKSHQKIGKLRKALAWIVLAAGIGAGTKIAIKTFRPHSSPKFVWEAMAEADSYSGFSSMFQLPKEQSIEALRQFSKQARVEFLKQRETFQRLPDYQQKDILDRLKKQGDKLCNEVAKRHDLSDAFLKAIYEKETSFISASVGATDDIGGGQFTPETLHDMYTKLHFNMKNPFNTYQSLEGIAVLLKYREDYIKGKPLFYDGRVTDYSKLSEEQKLMVLARMYNAGPGSIVKKENRKVDDRGRSGFDITPILGRDNAYSRSVIDNYRKNKKN